MRTLVKYDIVNIIKTKKLLVLIILFLLFALLAPVTARYMPELLSNLAVGIQIEFPEPTVYDSYIQFFGDLNEIILYVLMFMAVSFFIRDKTKGHLPMILSKPVSRKNYILSKILTYNALIIDCMIIAGLGFGLYTFIIFGELHIGLLSLALLVQFVRYMFVIAVCMLFSSLFKSYFAAIGAAFGVNIVFGILGAINIRAFDFLPNKLVPYAMQVMTESVNYTDMWITFGIVLVLIVLMIFGSIKIFRNQEVN